LVHLLDVNVLVALFDADHVHHEVAHDWFADHRAGGWATSPTTENGFVRILSNPAYGSPVARAAEILDRLRAFRTSGHHRFWADAVSFADEALFRTTLVRGHKQVTDIYLLGLAKAMGGRLATFDRTIPVGAVAGATPRTLAVIGTVDGGS
jgi:hypothetical protein